GFRCWSSLRRLYSVLFFILAVCVLLGNCMVAADDSSDSVDPSTINPMGLTFNYQLGWVDVTSSTFGVTIQAVKHSTYVDGTPWSLLIRFDPSARANITEISDGWGLGVYDYSSWVLLPSKSLFEPMYFTVHSTGQMNLENTVMKLAVPTKFILIADSTPKPSSNGYKLIEDRDYYINTGNLAELPKSAYGAWRSLVNTNAELILNVTEEPSSTVDLVSAQSGSVLPSNANFNVIINGVELASATLSNGSEASSTQTPADYAKEAGAAGSNTNTMETLLPPVKYIKGNPDYDPDMDPIGTVYGAPLIGPILVNIVLGIGFIVHVAGTIRRYQYRHMYQTSLLQANTGGATFV
ncbi:hypothetical protein BX070DRAFT_225651, partial [Coemansia spiralis]